MSQFIVLRFCNILLDVIYWSFIPFSQNHSSLFHGILYPSLYNQWFHENQLRNYETFTYWRITQKLNSCESPSSSRPLPHATSMYRNLSATLNSLLALYNFLTQLFRMGVVTLEVCGKTIQIDRDIVFMCQNGSSLFVFLIIIFSMPD